MRARAPRGPRPLFCPRGRDPSGSRSRCRGERDSRGPGRRRRNGPWAAGEPEGRGSRRQEKAGDARQGHLPGRREQRCHPTGLSPSRPSLHCFEPLSNTGGDRHRVKISPSAGHTVHRAGGGVLNYGAFKPLQWPVPTSPRLVQPHNDLTEALHAPEGLVNQGLKHVQGNFKAKDI